MPLGRVLSPRGSRRQDGVVEHPADGTARLDPRTAHNRATYDRIAPAYAASKTRPVRPATSSALDAPRDDFARLLPPSALVADLGCGSGEDAAWFSDRGFSVLGVDLSTSMARLTCARLGSSRVAVGDLRALPVRDSSVDAVWSAAALLHVPHAGTGLVLAGVRRILRPGGAVGLVTALGEGTREEPVPYAPGESRWFVYRDPAALADELARAGLRVTASGEVAGNRRWGWYLATALA
jgi:SAM-dependent methyltransferase